MDLERLRVLLHPSRTVAARTMGAPAGLDLRALFTPTGNKFTVIAYVKNVFDTEGYAAAVAASQRNNNPSVPSDQFANGAPNFELTPPRLYGVELQYRF